MVTPVADIIQDVYDTSDKAIKTKLTSGDIKVDQALAYTPTHLMAMRMGGFA